jgi:hypothetical protein
VNRLTTAADTLREARRGVDIALRLEDALWGLIAFVAICNALLAVFCVLVGVALLSGRLPS